MGRRLGSARLAGLLLGACAGPPRHFASPPAPAAAGYAVRAGDTLYSIAFRNGLDYHDLARWNGIGADYRIDVGQRLLLHPPAGGAATATPRASAELALPVTVPPPRA